MAATSAGEKLQSGELRPNLDRLTVGVDLGDQWSHYCILGLEGETLANAAMRSSHGKVPLYFLTASTRSLLAGFISSRLISTGAVMEVLFCGDPELPAQFEPQTEAFHLSPNTPSTASHFLPKREKV